MSELLSKIYSTDLPVSIPREFNYTSYRKPLEVKVKVSEACRVRACYKISNFGGFPSSVCLNPSAHLKGDKTAEYRGGKQVAECRIPTTQSPSAFRECCYQEKGHYQRRLDEQWWSSFHYSYACRNTNNQASFGIYRLERYCTIRDIVR